MPMSTIDPLLLRFLERLTAVLIGGLSIYLGYRLFLRVPDQVQGSGKFALPWDVSVVVNRVGPGVFFALFGALATCIALFSPLKINPPEHQNQGDSIVYASAVESPGNSARNSDARALLRREIAVLNTIPRVLAEELPEYERNDIQRSLGRVKILLMKPVWGDPAEGFGNFTDFAEWAKSEEVGTPPAGMEGALSLYHYGEAP